MKTIRLKLLALMWVIGIALPIASQAYDFKFDGICYNILSEEDRTVAVTYHSQFKDNNNYFKGDISISPKVIYKSKSYSVTEIGDKAFHKCSGLTSVDIPSSVTEIRSYAFYKCSGLTSVDIPSSVTTIGDYAFSGCSGLTSVDIPSSVTKIGDYAFDSTAYNSVRLEKIYCHWEKPIKISALVFEDKCLMYSILYVPIGTKAEYEKEDPWRNFWNIEEIDYESMSGVSDITHSSGDDIEEVTRWDVSGKHVSKDYKGLVIVRYSDGSTKKYINR